MRAPESRFGAQREYAFRHSLLRDAAYAMLTEDDRIAAHALAGQWLEQTGETNGRVLSEHFERGGEPARALPWVARAAKSALDAGDVNGAVELAKKGVALGADGETRGLLLAIHGEALSWDAQWDEVLCVSREARSFLVARTAPWWRATAAFVAAATAGGKPAEAAAVIQTLLEAPPDLTGQPLAAARVQLDRGRSDQHRPGGSRGRADGSNRRDEEADGPHRRARFDAGQRRSGVFGLAHARRVRPRDPGRRRPRARHSDWEIGPRPCSPRSAIRWARLRCMPGWAWPRGRPDESTTPSRTGRGQTLLGPSGGSWLRLYAEFYLAGVKLRRGQVAGIEEALAPVRASADKSASQLAHALTVELRLREGRIEDAISAANVAASGPSAVSRPTGAAILARIYLALGRVREALEAAERGLPSRRPSIRSGKPGSWWCGRKRCTRSAISKQLAAPLPRLARECSGLPRRSAMRGCARRS